MGAEYYSPGGNTPQNDSVPSAATASGWSGGGGGPECKHVRVTRPTSGLGVCIGASLSSVAATRGGPD